MPEESSHRSPNKPMPSASSTGAQSTYGTGSGKESTEEGEPLSEVAEDHRRKATRKAKEVFQRRREDGANRVKHLQSAVGAAADRLRKEEEEQIAEYADALADGCEEFSDYLMNCSLETVVSDISHQVRKQPVLFFGGVFVAGLALSRFLKASEPESGDEEFETYGRYDENPSMASSVPHASSKARKF